MPVDAVLASNKISDERYVFRDADKLLRNGNDCAAQRSQIPEVDDVTKFRGIHVERVGMARSDTIGLQFIPDNVSRSKPVRLQDLLKVLRVDRRLLDVKRLGEDRFNFLLDRLGESARPTLAAQNNACSFGKVGNATFEGNLRTTSKCSLNIPCNSSKTPTPYFGVRSRSEKKSDQISSMDIDGSVRQDKWGIACQCNRHQNVWIECTNISCDPVLH